MLQVRELPPTEWKALIEQGLPPYAVSGLPPDNGHWRILVAEVDGQIVAHTSVHTQVHFDPWYVSPTHGLGAVRSLLTEGRDLLLGLGIDHVFCTIDDSHLLTIDLAERLGFRPAPGKLYLLNLNELKGL